MEKICQIAGFRLEDLFGSVPREPQLLEHLTQQHEIELLNNKKLFAVAVSAMYFWTFKDILNRFKVNKTELVTLLQRLEEMGVVQVSPGNQFKLTISKKFSWIPAKAVIGFNVLKQARRSVWRATKRRTFARGE